MSLEVESREALARGMFAASYAEGQETGDATWDTCEQTYWFALADALLAPGVVQVTTPTETDEAWVYRGRHAHVIGEERTTVETAREAALDALADYPFEFPERYDDPVIERRRQTQWQPMPATNQEDAS